MTTLSPISVRMTKQERDMLQQAADSSRTNLSDYIRRKAIEAAEAELLDRRTIAIPADKWEEFEAWAASPSRDIPELRALAGWRAPWKT